MYKETEKRLIRTLEFLKEPQGSTIPTIVRAINGERPQISLKRIVQTLRGCLDNGTLQVADGRIKLKNSHFGNEENFFKSCDRPKAVFQKPVTSPAPVTPLNKPKIKPGPVTTGKTASVRPMCQKPVAKLCSKSSAKESGGDGKDGSCKKSGKKKGNRAKSRGGGCGGGSSHSRKNKTKGRSKGRSKCKSKPKKPKSGKGKKSRGKCKAKRKPKIQPYCKKGKKGD